MSRANGGSFVFALCFVAARSRWIQARRHDMKSSSLSVELLVLSMALLRSGALSHKEDFNVHSCLLPTTANTNVQCGMWTYTAQSTNIVSGTFDCTPHLDDDPRSYGDHGTVSIEYMCTTSLWKTDIIVQYRHPTLYILRQMSQPRVIH